MPSIIFFVALAIVLAVVSAVDVAPQAKVVVTKKAGGAVVGKKSSSGNYLNIWFYASTDTTCAGAVGYASSIPTNACYKSTLIRRNLAEAKASKSKKGLKQLEAIDHILGHHQRKQDSSKTKLAGGVILSERVSFAATELGTVDGFTSTISYYTDAACNTWDYDVATLEFGFDASVYPVDVCLGLPADGPRFKLSFSAQPSVPTSFNNNYYASTGFNADVTGVAAVCAASPYGSAVSIDQGLNLYAFQPINVCDWFGDIYKAPTGVSVTYDYYNDASCAVDSFDANYPDDDLFTTECIAGYMEATGVVGADVLKRIDHVTKATSFSKKGKKAALATSLRQ